MEKAVKQLIAGPGVYVCDECVGVCVEILVEKVPGWQPESLEDLQGERRAQLTKALASLGELLERMQELSDALRKTEEALSEEAASSEA